MFKTEFPKLLVLLGDRLLKSIIALAIGSLLAKNLNVDEFGKYTKEIMWYGLVETFGACGLNTTIAIFVVGQSDVNAKRILVHSILIKSAFSAALCLILIVLNALFDIFSGLNISAVSALTLVVSSCSLSEGFMVGRGAVNLLVSYKIGSIILFFLIRLLVFKMVGTQVESSDMVFLFCLEQIFISSILLWKNEVTIKIFQESVLLLREIYQLFYLGLQSWVNVCLIVVYMKFGQVWVAVFGSLEEISQYSVALQTVEMSYSLPVVFATIMTKRLVDEKKMGGAKEFDLTMQNILQVGNVASIVGVILLISCSKIIFDKIYGSKFHDAYRLFSVMILSLPFVTSGGIININTVSSEKISLMIKRSVIAVVIAVILTPFAFSEYGLIGLAWLIVLIQICANLLANLLFDHVSFWRQIQSLHFKIFKNHRFS